MNCVRANWVNTVATKRFGHVRNLLIILGVGATMANLAWVGYVGTDDQFYVRGALGWLNRFPYVGDNHWSFRHPVVIPLAMSLTIFGYREISLGLPSAFFFLIFLGVNYHYLQRFFNVQTAFLASAFLATTPLFVVYATFPQTVVVETLLLSISFWLFYSATRTQKPAWPMFGSGVALGLGLFVRETAGVIVLFYGILFILGFGVRRRYYWIMSLGFLLVVGIEISYFGMLTGDPFYRYRIDLSHEILNRSRWHRGTGDIIAVTGNLQAGGPIFQPVLSLLFNQEFGLVFWLVIPAAIWGLRAKFLAPQKQRLLQILTSLGLVWIVFISYSRLVSVVPRFYTVSLWAAIIVSVCWLRYYLYAYWPKVAIFVGTGLIAINLLCIYVDNKNPAFAERALVAYVLQHDGTIYTDPSTLDIADVLLEFKGFSHRVRSDPVPAGELYYYNKKNIDYCQRYGCPFSWKEYLPKDNWTVVTRIEPDRKLSGILLKLVGLDKIIPRAIFERLDKPNSGGVLYLTNPNGIDPAIVN